MLNTWRVEIDFLATGKSYALNHIVDSSFAGSAVRTTEASLTNHLAVPYLIDIFGIQGVWLSICPTRRFLVVALDFEGPLTSAFLPIILKLNLAYHQVFTPLREPPRRICYWYYLTPPYLT